LNTERGGEPRVSVCAIPEEGGNEPLHEPERQTWTDNEPQRRRMLNARELSLESGLSESTIWRYKRQGLIPFVQPKGPNGRVLFPADALECSEDEPKVVARATANPPARLPGRKPKWSNDENSTGGPNG